MDVLNGRIGGRLGLEGTKTILQRGLYMECIIKGEFKKIRDFKKKDGSSGQSVEMYVDGDRGEIMNFGLDGHLAEVTKSLGKRVTVVAEIRLYDGRMVANLKKITEG